MLALVMEIFQVQNLVKIFLFFIFKECVTEKQIKIIYSSAMILPKFEYFVCWESNI